MKPLLVFVLSMFICHGHGLTQTGQLEITVTDISNQNGLIQVALFQQKEGFPNDYKESFLSMNREINGSELTFELTDLSYGEYALAVLHDENRNGKMDYNFLKMPKEGYGTSNNARGKFGPPRYRDAKFELSSESKSLQIKLNY